jgi:hypothetical protein
MLTMVQKNKIVDEKWGEIDCKNAKWTIFWKQVSKGIVALILFIYQDKN